MGIFSCLPVLCVRLVCVFPVGSSGLLKLSQLAGAGKLANTGWCRMWSGTGGYVFPRITEVLRWYRGIFCRKNIGKEAMATFHNSYRKCYNKCNDDNKNVISHQTVKFAL